MRALILPLLASLSLLAATAHAQPAPAAPQAPSTSPSQEDRDRANALMDDGDAKVASGDLTGALTAYKSAHGIMHVPSTGIEVARTLDKLGKLLPALAAAREVAAMPAVAGEPKQFTASREAAGALVTSLETRIPTLAITVKIAATNIRPEVMLDRRPLTAAELASPLPLEPGTYRVAASADGHAPTSVEVVLKERDRGKVALVLAPVVEAPPAPTLPPPARPVTLSPFVPAGFTVAGAGVLAGVITGALALSAAGEANKLCPAGVCGSESIRATAQGRYDAADTLAVASDVSFVLAIAGAAVGIYGVAVSLSPSPPPDAPAKSATKLVLGPGTAALHMTF